MRVQICNRNPIVIQTNLNSKPKTRNGSKAMKEDKPDSSSPGYLRCRAEELLRKKKIKDVQKMTEEDVRAMAYELQVHQIELEMQNEELKRARQELEESRNKYLELYEFSPIGYFTLDKQGAILEVNLSGAALLGVERGSLVRRRFQLFVETDLRPDFNSFCNRMFGSDVKQTCELRLVKNDASPLYAYLEGIAMRDGEGNVKQCQIAVVDITKRKHAEEEQVRLKDELFHARNLASVGKLAGGVAHNFNNLLTVVMGYASLLATELKEDDPLREYAQKIIHSSQIAANLTQDLLAFSRKKPLNLQPVNMNKIIEDTEGILSKLLRENIKLGTALSDKDCVVMADSHQIMHVLMNLATNARDAMPNGGELKICTDSVGMDDVFIKAHGFGETGKYVLISISDTGVGMDGRTRLRVFEPFFTTKEVGRGTGLGLASVYGLVKQHNGYIEVESEAGNGTTFRIYLPLVTPRVSGIKTEAESMPKGGTETILLAEDEDDVRSLMKIALERNGYEVIEAVDGKEAVDKFVRDEDKIKFLLFDVIMPAKSGRQAYDEIKKIKPDLKAPVLFMTGYSDDVVRKGNIIDSGLDYILKPVSPIRLLEKVREVLDR